MLALQNHVFIDRNWKILDVLRAIASEFNRPPAEVALSWAMARPCVTSTIIGASKLSQLESNIAATGLTLSREQMQRLNEASAPPLGFSSGLTMPAIRRMVFGGHNISGWGE